MFRYERMRRACAAMLAALLLAGSGLLAPSARADTDGVLRVKLTRLGAPASVTLTAECALIPSLEGAEEIPADAAVTVTAAGGQLTAEWNGRSAPAGSALRLTRAADGGLRFQSPVLSNRFCGDLTLTASGDVVVAVLSIYVEDYLCGVVGYEMPPSAGADALRAQAIAARSYALCQRTQAGGGAYDLTDTSGGFTYKGECDGADYANANQAVADTQGVVLWYGDGLACGWCTESNGGQMESASNAFGTQAAYTAVADDGYDYESAGAKKTAILPRTGEGLVEPLRALLVDAAASNLRQVTGEEVTDVRITAIEAITPVEPRFDEPSRLYGALRFDVRAEGVNAKGNSAAAELSVSVPTYGALESWYDLSINDGDNETVWVDEQDDGFAVTFRRSGHGVGMSQRGAQLMAGEYRMSYETILSYYYPGTRLVKLTLGRQAATQPAATAKAAPIAIASARLMDRAELRKKPSDAAETLAVLPAGARVEIYAANHTWAAAGSGGKVGYVPLSELSDIALAGAGVMRMDAPESATLTDAAELLRLPLGDAEVLRTLPAGTALSVVARSARWVEVSLSDGASGFLAADTARLEENSGFRAVTGDAPANSSDEGGSFTRITGKKKRYVYVSADSLELRQDYSASSPVLATLSRGQKLVLGAYNAKWAYVSTGRQKGFVLRSGLSAKKPAAKASGGGSSASGIPGGAVTRVNGRRIVIVRSAQAVLYQSYSTDSQQLDWLSQGDRVQLLAYNQEWAYVYTGTQRGFMQVSALVSGDASGGSRMEFDARTLVDLKLYADATMSGTALATVPKGSTVRVLGYQGQAAHVQYNRLTGYMPIGYLIKK